MTKTIYLTIMLAITNILAIAQTNIGARQLKRELDRLCNDKDLKVQATHYNTAIYTWYFKFLYETNDSTAPVVVPKAIRRMEQAFLHNADKATNVLFHEASKQKDSSIPIKDIVYSFPDGKNRYNSFIFYLDNSYNFYSATYAEDNGLRIKYQLIWKPEFFIDKDSRLFCTINGSISEISSKDWEVQMTDIYEGKRHHGNFDKMLNEADNDTISGNLVAEQMKVLLEKYKESEKNNDKKMCDAIALLTKNLSIKFTGMLTEYQYREIKDAIFDIITRQTEIRNQRVSDLIIAITYFKNKSETKLRKPWNTDNIKNMTVLTNRLCEQLRDQCYDKLTEEVFDYKPNITQRPIIKFKISGESKSEGQLIGLRGNHMDNTYGTRVTDKKFNFTVDKLLNSIVTIYDQAGNEIYAIADTVPLVVDMERGIISGSETNLKLQAIQDRIKTLKTEAKKYVVDIDHNVEVTDSAGFFALIDTLTTDVIKYIKANKDNEIPAYLLYSYYQKLTFQQLSECLDSTHAFAHNVIVQPVWDYYNGLKKRQPGRRFTDFECKGTDGKRHKLSDYIGNGYLLLDFWSLNSYASRNGFPEIKKLNKLYGDKGLTIVSVALYNDEKEWKQYVKKRDLDKWPNLIAHEEFESEAAKAYGIRTATEIVIIGPDGRIVDYGLLDYSLIKKVEELMKSYSLP